MNMTLIIQELQAMTPSQRAEMFSHIQERFCLTCGEEISEGADYCMFCADEDFND